MKGSIIIGIGGVSLILLLFTSLGIYTPFSSEKMNLSIKKASSSTVGEFCLIENEEKLEVDPELLSEKFAQLLLTASDPNESEFKEFLSLWFASNFEEARYSIVNLENPVWRDQLISPLAQEMFRREGKQSFSWVEGLPSENQKILAAQAMIESSALADGEFVEWIEKSGKGDFVVAAVELVGKEWQSSNEQKAAELFLQLPSGEVRNRGFVAIFQSWSNRDPEGSSQWLNDHLVTAELDGGILGLVQSMAETENLDYLLEWVALIEDRELRQRAEEELRRARS